MTNKITDQEFIKQNLDKAFDSEGNPDLSNELMINFLKHVAKTPWEHASHEEVEQRIKSVENIEWLSWLERSNLKDAISYAPKSYWKLIRASIERKNEEDEKKIQELLQEVSILRDVQKKRRESWQWYSSIDYDSLPILDY